MKFLAFSDLHCHAYEQFSTRLANGRNSRFQDCLNIIHQVKAVVESDEVDWVFFLGDLFHSRTKVDVDVFSSTYSAMRDLSKALKGNLMMLIGNHDQNSKVGEVHSLEAFKEIAHVVTETVMPFRFYDYDNSEVTALFCSHTEDIPKLVGDIRGHTAERQFDFLCLHQAISEGSLGSMDMRVKHELSLKDLPLDKFRIVMAGDYHKRQFLADGKFHYVGSPLQLSFGEAGETKAFSLIDTKNWEIETLTTSAPKFFEFTPIELVQAKEAKAFTEKDFVRVITKRAADVDFIKQMHPTVEVKLEEEEQSAIVRVSKDALVSDRLLLETFIRSGIPDGLDPDLVLNEGLDILMSVGVEDA